MTEEDAIQRRLDVLEILVRNALDASHELAAHDPYSAERSSAILAIITALNQAAIHIAAYKRLRRALRLRHKPAAPEESRREEVIEV